MTSRMKIYMAPLQGFTEYPYRSAHAEICGGVALYYTPFIRFEHGEIRRKDLRDIQMPDSSDAFCQVPQVIASGAEEFEILCRAVIGKGYKSIDLNMGCPFPLQTAKGKGSALICRPDKLRDILSAMQRLHDSDNVHFSVKMRLGMEDPSECMDILPLLNDSCIERITVHPRIAKQQYKGSLDMDAFEKFFHSCSKPVCFNGDILSVHDIESVQKKFPSLESIMIGRGLLSRPTLATEYMTGATFSDDEVRKTVLAIHDKVFSYYLMTLEGGSGQILQKIQPFWVYQQPLFGKKIIKSLTKTRSLGAYEELIAKIK